MLRIIPNLKTSKVNTNTWEAEATNRSAWRNLCRVAAGEFEKSRIAAAKEKRAARKSRVPPRTRSLPAASATNSVSPGSASCHTKALTRAEMPVRRRTDGGTKHVHVCKCMSVRVKYTYHTYVCTCLYPRTCKYVYVYARTYM